MSDSRYNPVPQENAQNWPLPPHDLRQWESGTELVDIGYDSLLRPWYGWGPYLIAQESEQMGHDLWGWCAYGYYKDASRETPIYDYRHFAIKCQRPEEALSQLMHSLT